MYKRQQWIITFSNGFRISETVVTSWIIMAFLIIASYFLTRNLKLIPTSKVQIMLEYAVVTLKNLVESNMGKDILKKMPNMFYYICLLYTSRCV